MRLNEGEVICDECNGTGVLFHTISGLCSKCNGKGKLDWVTNAMGKQTPEIWYAPAGTYKGSITIDVGKGVSGTTYPIGTAAKPVNNLADAKIIAKERGLKC